MSQNQLRALAGKFGNAAILAKMFLTYEQFENFLRIISVAKPQPSNRAEKVQMFFEYIGQSLRIQFSEQNTTINRSNSSYSINSELNESNSSLDLSIKEALDTLKSETKKPVLVNNRVNLSPRPVGRAYSNPSTPKGRSGKGFGTESMNKIRVSLLSPTQSLRGFKPRVKVELDEFLETEKLVQKEISNIKVNIRTDHAKRDNKTIAKQTDPKAKPTSRFLGLQVVTKEKQLEKLVGNLTTLLNKHKKFIERIQSARISKKFITKLSFKIWVLETLPFKCHQKILPEAVRPEEKPEEKPEGKIEENLEEKKEEIINEAQ